MAATAAVITVESHRGRSAAVGSTVVEDSMAVEGSMVEAAVASMAVVEADSTVVAAAIDKKPS
jgi:hypothetical protein